jgi:Novel STAND NTPase 1
MHLPLPRLRFRFGLLGSTRTCVVFFAMRLPVRGRLEVWNNSNDYRPGVSLDDLIRPSQHIRRNRDADLFRRGQATCDRRVAEAKECHDCECTATRRRPGWTLTPALSRRRSMRGSSQRRSREALIRGWPRLRQWIDDDRSGLRIHRRITESWLKWFVCGTATPRHTLRFYASRFLSLKNP